MKKFWASLLLLSAAAFAAAAQIVVEGKVEIDHTVHDFGDVRIDAGPQNCVYTFTNVSDGEMIIFNVVSSCGCTAASWTRDAIPAGGKGVVNATYKNEDGPYPFDKTLTVYVSTVTKPVILRLRGVVQEKPRPLAETYPVHMGALGLRETEIKVGNLSQGEQKSGSVKVANISNSPVKLSFKDVSPNLTLKVEPETIPAQGTATLTYTVNASRDLWGKNWYYATPVVGGKAQKKLSFWAFTKENFSNLSKKEQLAGSMPYFDASTFEFGKVSAGAKVKAGFSLRNKGRSDLVIYKIDVDEKSVKILSSPGTLKPGESGKIELEFDTSAVPPGSVSVSATLTTNSPLRPFLDLYIAGEIR